MTHHKPLFTMRCPAGANPIPFIELAMQGRFREVPHYKYVRVDAESVAVIVHVGHDEARTRPRITVRQVKVFAIISLLGLLLLFQQVWLGKNGCRQIEQNQLNNRAYHIVKRLDAIKVTKALRAVLERSVYIRSLEITHAGWHIEAMGLEDEVKKLSDSWQTSIPIVSSLNGIAIINGGGVW